MHSSPPVRAPKSQPTVEQPCIGGHCNPSKKDAPCPKTKKKPQWDGRRDAIMLKSSPILAGWAAHKLENNNTKEVLPLLWRFWAPMSGFLPWGSGKGTWNPQGIWLWRPVGFDYRTSTRLGKTETRFWVGTNRILCVPRPREKAQWPHRTLTQDLPASVGGSPMEVWASSGSLGGGRDPGNSRPGRCPLV